MESNKTDETRPAESSGDAIATSAGKCLLAISDQERSMFLPEDLFQELKQTVGEIKHVQPQTLSDVAWPQLLQEFGPDVVIGAWSTKPIPEDIPVESGPLKYYCGLTGSVRRKIARSLIERGLHVTNWGTSISRTIAESALMMILGCLRRTSHWHEVMHHERGWHKHPENEGQFSLFERRVGIRGFGRISRELVLLLKPFNVKVSTFSSVPESLLREYDVSRASSMEDLFSGNDIIVELAALTDRTRHSVTEELLRMIPQDGVFVNVGRGAVVDEAALARVAREGRVRIALDVYEKEPLPKDSPLRGLNRAILMPHQAGPTPDRMRDSGALAVANVRQFLAGNPLEGVVDLQGYDQMT